MADPNAYVHKLLCPISGPNDFIPLHVQVPSFRPIDCNITLHAVCRGRVYKAELRHSKRATYRHSEFDGDEDHLEALLVRALLPSDSVDSNERILMSAMSFPSRVEITLKVGDSAIPFAVLRLYPTDDEVDVEMWALQACHGRDGVREELGAAEEELRQAQKAVIKAQKDAIKLQQDVIEAQTVAKELQETVDDLQNSLLEETNISETLSARLRKFTQLNREKAALAALKVAVSARKLKVRELTETVEQYGEMPDLLSVEPSPEPLLIERSGQTPTQTESCTPEQQPCKKRKMNYLQDE